VKGSVPLLILLKSSSIRVLLQSSLVDIYACWFQADITRLLQMAATYDGKSFFTLRFSWLKICMETGFGWLLGLKEAVAVWVKVCNLKTRPQRKSPPQLVHKIKMASCHMSMDEVAKTYKITPVRRI